MKESSSEVLTYLYGQNYVNELGNGCISFRKEHAEKKSLWRYDLRMLALLLAFIPFLLNVILFPLLTLVAFLTNWIECLTLLTCILVLWFSSDPEIHEKKWRLALLHTCF